MKKKTEPGWCIQVRVKGKWRSLYCNKDSPVVYPNEEWAHTVLDGVKASVGGAHSKYRIVHSEHFNAKALVKGKAELWVVEFADMHISNWTPDPLVKPTTIRRELNSYLAQLRHGQTDYRYRIRKYISSWPFPDR